jgi:hypothetical protein
MPSRRAKKRGASDGPRVPKLSVGVFDDESGHGVGTTLEALTSAKTKLQVITGDDIRRDNGAKLREIDAIVVPGGSSARHAEKLGETGMQLVKSFVRGGGAYLGECNGIHSHLFTAVFAATTSLSGICAGAYLATSGYNGAPSLELFDAKVRLASAEPATSAKAELEEPPSTPWSSAVSAGAAGAAGAASSPSKSKKLESQSKPPPWVSGQGLARVKFTALGRSVLWETARLCDMVDEEEGGMVTLRYSNGPLFECNDFPDGGGAGGGATVENTKAQLASSGGGRWSRAKERAYQSEKYNYQVLAHFESRRIRSSQCPSLSFECPRMQHAGGGCTAIRTLVPLMLREPSCTHSHALCHSQELSSLPMWGQGGLCVYRPTQNPPRCLLWAGCSDR